MTETKHLSKRLISILLAVCMALAFIPLQTSIRASAASDDQIILQEGVDSEDTGWTFDGSNNRLTLENADLYYSGSSSLFSFECPYAYVVLKGYNRIQLGAEGASAFSLPDHDLGIINSSGILEIKGSGVYLAEKDSFVTVDSGFILTPGIKAAGNGVTTINGGYVEAGMLSETGAKLHVNGGYVYAGASYGDVTVMGGFVHEWDAFMGGSLTFRNCVIQTMNISEDCKVEQLKNDYVLILEEDTNNWSSKGILQDVKRINTSRNWKAYANEYYGSPEQISDGEHSGVFVDSGSGGSSEIGSGVTLSGGNYFFNDNADQPALIIKPGAKLADGINNSTIVGRNNSGTAIVLDSTDTSNTGDFKFGTLTGLGKDCGIKIEGSAKITGGRICGRAENGGAGIDISIENGGSISGETRLIGISKDGTGTEINGCPSADSSTSIIGFDKGNGNGLVKKSNNQLDCGLASCGNFGLDTDITYNTTFEFDLNSKTTTPFGDTLDYSQNCSGKGWEFYRNNYGDYEKYLPYQQPGMASSSPPTLLVLDNFSFSTLADEAVSIPRSNYNIKDVYIVVKGNCSLTGAKYGLMNSADTSITIIGADEDSRLTINVTDSVTNGAGIYKVTQKNLTIKDLNLSINAGAGGGICSKEHLTIYNSDITISQNADSECAISTTSSESHGNIYFSGSNNFTFLGAGKVKTKDDSAIYSCVFKDGSQAAADYNEKILNGETISEMVFSNGEKVSTVGFDFNTEKYNVSEITSEFDYGSFQTVFYVTLTDKDPDSAKRYGGEPFEIDLDDFFVGGSGNWNYRKGSKYTPKFTGDSFDIDCSTNVYSGTASNSDNTVTVGFRYSNDVSNSDVNVITSLPDDRGFYILYKFDIEQQPVISTVYNSEGGEVTASADKVRMGGDAEVTVTPKEGWVVGSVTLNGKDAELTDGKLSLTNVTEDQEIVVEFKRLYTVTVSVEGIDDISAVSPATSTYIEGEDAVFVVKDYEGYIAAVTLDGKPVQLTDGKYTIGNIDGNHTLSVKYEEKPATYQLTIECGPNGKSSFDDVKLIPEIVTGTAYDVVLTPEAGYQVKSVTVNGNALTVKNNKVSFTVTADTVLKIEFEKKSSGGSSGGHYSGGSGSMGTKESKPSINGESKSWSDIASDIAKSGRNDAITIDLNGETTLPEDVIKAIKDSGATVTVKIDSTKSWTIKGSDIKDGTSSADLSLLPGISSVKGARGSVGYRFSTGGNDVGADLTIQFKPEYAGKFANLYFIRDSKAEFASTAKVAEDGSVTFPNVKDKGEYVVMLSDYSDLSGDVDNDGKLLIRDALTALRHILELEKAANPEVIDFNNDGQATIRDALDILNHAIAK